MFHALCVVGMAIIGLTTACQQLTLQSDKLGHLKFSQITIDNGLEIDLEVGGGRANYLSQNGNSTIYLYHIVTNNRSGNGRWVINPEHGVPDRAMAFVDSWSIAPHIVRAVNDNIRTSVDQWKFPDDNGEWKSDDSFSMTCDQDDTIVFFESSRLQPALSGYYVQQFLSTNESKIVYSLVRPHSSDKPTYLHRMNNIWMIGETYSTDSGLAFAEDNDAKLAHEVSAEWKFVDTTTPNSSFVWAYDAAAVYSPRATHPQQEKNQSFSNIYEVVRFARGLKYIASDQQFITMRNGVPLPVLGLGTGGIASEQSQDMIATALRSGYRLLDLAREYNNEDIVAAVFELPAAGQGDQRDLPKRQEVFLQSKVWPTQLGFHPTVDALFTSLATLKTNYVDSYFLHWPRCDSEVQWMHCEDTQDAQGTWQQSYAALEKAYAEGLINSIGVSNFNIDLLNELASFATVLPHMVQNFAAVGELDEEVREWCRQLRVVYQPYASGRNIQYLPTEMLSAVQRVAAAHDTSSYAVVQKFFVQSGAAIIPRSSQAAHVVENMRVFSWDLSEEEMNMLGWSHEDSHEL